MTVIFKNVKKRFTSMRKGSRSSASVRGPAPANDRLPTAHLWN